MKNMTKLPYCSKCGKEVQYDVLTEENQILSHPLGVILSNTFRAMKI